MHSVITPVIDLDLKPMNNLTKESQNIICKCETKCKNYLYMDDYGRFCENDARNIALSIIALVEGIDRVKFNKKAGWTYDEDMFITRWYEKRGGKANYGDIRIIAKMLNRPLSATQAHIKYMQRMGRL